MADWTDEKIIELYWQRNPTAIAETERKYGKFCFAIAKNILTVSEDAEECVNDAYARAWDAIPPERPVRFRVWLGRVVRNLALNRYQYAHAKKRYAGMEQLLSELEECLPAQDNVEMEFDAKELTGILNAFISESSAMERNLFIRRYWHGIPVKQLAREYGCTSGQMAKRLYRIRQRLKTRLEQEGYPI